LPASYRLTIKPPLCQECAKTGRHSPTHRGQGGNQTAAELGICRHHRTVRNTVDRPARIYTPAVGGSIPSAPTNVIAGQRRNWRRRRVRRMLGGCPVSQQAAGCPSGRPMGQRWSSGHPNNAAPTARSMFGSQYRRLRRLPELLRTDCGWGTSRRFAAEGAGVGRARRVTDQVGGHSPPFWQGDLFRLPTRHD
jgi:hypothetical protein